MRSAIAVVIVFLSMSATAKAEDDPSKAARGAWLDCLYKDSEQIAKQPGSPKEVANAAFRRCEPYFRPMFDALTGPPSNMSKPDATKLLQRTLVDDYQTMVVAIMGLRDEQGTE